MACTAFHTSKHVYIITFSTRTLLEPPKYQTKNIWIVLLYLSIFHVNDMTPCLRRFHSGTMWDMELFFNTHQMWQILSKSTMKYCKRSIKYRILKKNNTFGLFTLLTNQNAPNLTLFPGIPYLIPSNLPVLFWIGGLWPIRQPLISYVYIL